MVDHFLFGMSFSWAAIRLFINCMLAVGVARLAAYRHTPGWLC
jgi:hypothetical protein